MMRPHPMARRVRYLYSWSGDELGRVGTVPEARLRAWEYDIVSQEAWLSRQGGATDVVHVWRTRRPDLAPPELLVGDIELLEET